MDTKEFMRKLENKHSGARVLIIGCGHSTSSLIPYKDRLKEKFDVVIGVNKSYVEFDGQMDYHMITEKTSKSNAYNISHVLNNGSFRTDLVRLINKKGIEFYNAKYNIIPISRMNYDVLDFKHYGNGFVSGPPSSQGFGLGSVMLQALHFSSILGAKEIYLIGADMCFKNDKDHFYGDDVYRNPPNTTKKENKHIIVRVGQFETTAYFRDSAAYLDQVISKYFGNRVFDFSDGLLSAATKYDLQEYMGH